MKHLLDNPIWEALSGFHQSYNEGDQRLKYFDPAMSPFIAMEHWEEAGRNYLDQHIPVNRNFFHIIRDTIVLPDSCNTVFSIPLYQLVCHHFKAFTRCNADIRPLGADNIEEMIALTALTKPGPFSERTIEFGNYVGIFEENRLAAMAGERLKAGNYTEVSAICTHPDFTGKGYGAQLLSHACQRIIKEGKIPFLHVRNDNARAIRMYEEAGFKIRSGMNFVIFRKDGE